MKDILVLNLPQCLKTFYISSRKKDESTSTSEIEDLSLQYITEKEYYNLLEGFLEKNKLNINDKSTTTNYNNNFEKKYKSVEDVDYCNVYKVNLNKKDNLKILNYHMKNIMCGGWIFDHEAHMKYSYYPSNVFPIGSNLEYMYFMRPWSRNVNNLYVNRLYKRYPDFNKLLEKIKNCPCNFLLQFNILNKDSYMYTGNTGNDLIDMDNDDDDDDGGGGGCNGGYTIITDKNIDNKMEICNNYTVDNNDDSNILYKISVDNELMMKSDFFLKKKYVHFNIWLYENLIKNNNLNKELSYCMLNSKDNIKHSNFNEEILISINENSKPLRLDAKVWFKYKIHQNKLEKQLINKLNKPKKKKFNGISNKQIIRLSAMKSILENIYFKNDVRENDDDDVKNNNINMSTENMLVNCNQDVDIKTLVRCENHNSTLYSPVLKLTDCKHLEESVYFVQRRSGDEISTEIRKCKECGNVKIL